MAESPQEELNRLKTELQNESSLGVQMGRMDKEERVRQLERQLGASTSSSPQSPAPSSYQSRDDDEFGDDDDSAPYYTPYQQTPPTRGEREVAAAAEEAQADQARAAEQARATADTPPKEASVPPQPGIAGDMKSAAPEEPAAPQAESEQPQPAQKPAQQPSRAEQGKQMAEDELKKGLKNWLAKTFTREALMAALTNPYVWGIALAILIIAVAIGIFAYLYSVSNSGANGKTPVQAVNALDNGSALQKLSLLAGDKDTQQKLSGDVLTQMKTNLSGLKNETTDIDLQKQIDTALDKLSQCQQNFDPAVCADAIKQVQALLKKFDDVIPPAQGVYPVRPEDMIQPGTPIADSNFNSDLHLGTPLRPASPSDTSGHGTYIKTGENKSDAIDIYTKAGAPVYAAFAGDIVDVSDDASGIAGAKKVVIKSGDYQMLYAFIIPDSAITVKGKVAKDQKIGTTSPTGLSLVHIEFIYCDVPLVDTKLDWIDKNSSTPAHTTWGAYYWDHLLKVLKIVK